MTQPTFLSQCHRIAFYRMTKLIKFVSPVTCWYQCDVRVVAVYDVNGVIKEECLCQVVSGVTTRTHV